MESLFLLPFCPIFGLFSFLSLQSRQGFHKTYIKRLVIWLVWLAGWFLAQFNFSNSLLIPFLAQANVVDTLAKQANSKLVVWFVVHSVWNWVTDRVLKLVWVTIFSKIQTSDGHYSCINSLEKNTIICHYFCTKLNSMIAIPSRCKV